MLREYFSTARGAFFARLLCRAALALACAAGAAAQGAGTSHPLDPLTRDEINAAAQVLKDAGKVTDKSRFSTVVLSEPPKAEVLAFRPGGEARREAFAVVYEREANKTFEAVVDVKGKRLVSWKEIPGAQPPMLIEDVLIMQSVLRGDPQWQAAMRKRGITDLQDVVAEPWSAGGFGFREEAGVRVFKGVSFLRGKGVRNHYARPIEGVIAVVDLNRKRVIKLIDSGVVPVPQATAELGQGAAGPLRLAPKPLVVAQPDGPGFEVNGHEVRWQNWRFRYALHPREGLVLYTVGYEDQGRLRPILYRAALSEMVVPYGDPGEAWFFRNAFDVGEYGVGRSALQLEPGTDLPANAQTFGVVFAGETGGGFEARDRVAPANSCSPTSPTSAITSTASTGSFIRTARSRWKCCSPGSWRRRASGPRTGASTLTALTFTATPSPRAWRRFTTSTRSTSDLISTWTARARTASSSRTSSRSRRGRRTLTTTPSR
jgi:Cu2+-containing amine oxidase